MRPEVVAGFSAPRSSSASFLTGPVKLGPRPSNCHLHNTPAMGKCFRRSHPAGGGRLQGRHPGPRTIMPGLAPVCSPSRTTATPFTKTSRIPAETWWGSSYVARSMTVSGKIGGGRMLYPSTAKSPMACEVGVAAGWVSPWSPGLGPWERCPHSIQTERIRANYWLRNQLESCSI